MMPHNRTIFHCLTCGNLVHADPNVRPPECCGYQMVRAAAETVGDADVSGAKEMESCEIALIAEPDPNLR